MIKYVVFNVMYIPAVLVFQELLFAEVLSKMLLAGVVAAGQVGLYIFDRAYEHVQGNIWIKFRGRLLGD